MTQKDNGFQSFYEAVMIAEGVQEATEEEQTKAWQYLHDTKIGYQLQGTFGRTLRMLIQEGIIEE